MRLRAAVVAAAVLWMSACGGGGGGDGGPVTPQPTTGTVRGTVSDQNGAAVANASVQLSATGQATRSATTDAGGAYTFTSVTAGTYTVTVTPPTGFTLGTSTGTSTVVVVAGQQASVAAIVLNKTTISAPTSVNISMANTAFSPASAEVAAGGSVTFTNNDNVEHNATPNSGGFTATGNFAPGGQRTVTAAATPGTFAYRCTLHAGMTGTLIVR